MFFNTSMVYHRPVKRSHSYVRICFSVRLPSRTSQGTSKVCNNSTLPLSRTEATGKNCGTVSARSTNPHSKTLFNYTERQFVPLSVHTQSILPRDWSLDSSKLSPYSAFQCDSVRFLSKLPRADIKHSNTFSLKVPAPVPEI
jgi:hypothetical protein